MFLILSYRLTTDTIFSANDNKVDVLLDTYCYPLKSLITIFEK
jgi:hypothetical protein